MHSAFPKAKARRFRSRRTSGDRLREALLEMAQGKAMVLKHEEKAWASVTFSGSRHEIILCFDGAEAIEAGENFIVALPDHEFTIHGHLVADATINEVDHSFGDSERLMVTAALLLLEDN